MQKTFQSIYKENYKRLYTLAFRMTGSIEDTEDVLQESFLSAYKAFPKFRGDSSVYTWLYKITLNASKKFVKQREKLPVDEYADLNNLTNEDVYGFINSFGSTEDKALIERTKESCLQMFMNCLSGKHRAIYTLRIILRFSVKDTSEIMDLSQSNVKTTLHRAKNHISNFTEGRCSLLKPGAMCNCRLYAAYLAKSNKTKYLQDFEVIRENEQKAVKDFNDEMCKILDVDDLYQTTIVPLKYESFITRVKNLKSNENLRLLEK